MAEYVNKDRNISNADNPVDITDEQIKELYDDNLKEEQLSLKMTQSSYRGEPEKYG